MIPRLCALALTLVFAASLSDSLLRIPIQPSDSLELMLEAQRSPSAAASFAANLSAHGYMRPAYRAQNKVLFDLGPLASYQTVFRGFHALLLSAALVLFANAARVRTGRDLAAFAMALVVWVGLHTFRGAVQEAYPVNHYLNVLVMCLLTLTLTQSKGGLWADGLAVIGLLYALLILETGVLVWVVAVTAWAVGWRGLSRPALVAMTVVLAGYLYVRFASTATGLPTLSERSTGYLLAVLDPPELQRRFSDHPMRLYAYNVATSVASVLFSEPRAGRFVAVAAWLQGALLPRMTLAIVTSAITTGGILFTAVRRARAGRLDDDARFLAVAALVVAGNAALSFAYTKDEILIPAGAFYALAAYAAWREVLSLTNGPRGTAVALTVLLTLTAAGWSVRASSLHFVMRTAAFKHRNDWAELPGAWRRSGTWPRDAAEARLVSQLRAEALATPAPNPRFEPPWLNLIWEE